MLETWEAELIFNSSLGFSWLHQGFIRGIFQVAFQKDFSFVCEYLPMLQGEEIKQMR